MFVYHETARILLTQNQIYLLEVSLLVHQPFLLFYFFWRSLCHHFLILYRATLTLVCPGQLDE